MNFSARSIVISRSFWFRKSFWLVAIFCSVFPSMSWPHLLAAFFSCAFAVGFELNPGETQCFMEAATKGSAVTTIFQVTHGGYLDVDVQVHSTITQIYLVGIFT